MPAEPGPSPTEADADGFSAWQPGIASRIPNAFRDLETIVQEAWAATDHRQLDELSAMTGLPHEELASFRPMRLALHELIIRVTADIAVAEGDTEEQFGEHFRQITRRIFGTYLWPRAASLIEQHTALHQRSEQRIGELLARHLRSPPVKPRRWTLFRRRKIATASTGSIAEHEHQVILGFKASGLAASDPFERAICKSLYRVLGMMAGSRGSLIGDHDLLTKLVANHVCNAHGSHLIGLAIAPLVDAAIAAEGYSRVRNQAAPILISLKGASAAGKSSIRPMVQQRLLDGGIEVDGYGTISPDVWRRLLLDYDSLDAAAKYAGHLTSREVMIIDAKLDQYIRDKAARTQAIPHLLVDRFRFDSLSSRSIGRLIDETYARYVAALHMVFIVTPPEATVERGWLRGLKRGRYKAVEEFLGHCVEAYSGMPRVLFQWLEYPQVNYHYQFLDNRVPNGTFPSLIASGTRNHMTICDPLGMIDIARYQKINVYAGSPDEVYAPPESQRIAGNTGFLHDCLRRIPRVSFATPAGAGAPIYLEFRHGKASLLDPDIFADMTRDPQLAAVMRDIAPQFMPPAAP